MDKKLKGRSAILARRINELQDQIAFCDSLLFGAENHEPDENRLRLEVMLAELNRERTHKRVVLLGTEHRSQRLGDRFNQQLADRIFCLSEQLAATVLMEEWPQNAKPSFASTLGIAYQNVGTGSEEEFRTYPNSVQYPGYIDGTLDYSEEYPSFAEYGPLKHQENRENKMVQNIHQAMESHDVGLLLIGLAHLHSISQKLLNADFNVCAFAWIPERSDDCQGPVAS